MLSVITWGEFEGEEKVVPISLSQVIGITFFSGARILECIWFYDTAYKLLLSGDVCDVSFFWGGTSGFCIASFCVWLIVLRILSRIDVIFPGRMLFMVTWYFSLHYVKSVQIWSFFSRITGKCGPEKRTNLETFHAVLSMTSVLLKFSGDPVNKHHQNIWGMISRSYNSISWYVMLNLNKNYVFLL